LTVPWRVDGAVGGMVGHFAGCVGSLAGREWLGGCTACQHYGTSAYAGKLVLVSVRMCVVLRLIGGVCASFTMVSS